MKPKGEPEIKFLLNGVKINDRSNNPKDVLSHILSTIPNVECWNPEALKELLIGTLNMTSDFAREAIKGLRGNPEMKKEVTKLTRFSSRAAAIARNLIKRPIEENWVPAVEDGTTSWDRIIHSPIGLTPKQLMQKVFDLALSGEGLSVIPGFHYAAKQICRRA